MLTPEAALRPERVELKQVVLNLCVNAAEAIAPRRRAVRIELREPRPDEPISPTSVVLAVVDDGAGWTPRRRRTSSSPTSRPRRPVTGSGCPTVYGIVKRAAARSRCDSAPGAGTTFRIALPMAAARDTPR